MYLLLDNEQKKTNHTLIWTWITISKGIRKQTKIERVCGFGLFLSSPWKIGIKLSITLDDCDYIYTTLITTSMSLRCDHTTLTMHTFWIYILQISDRYQTTLTSKNVLNPSCFIITDNKQVPDYVRYELRFILLLSASGKPHTR